MSTSEFDDAVEAAAELRFDALRKTIFEMPVHTMASADEALVWLVEHMPPPPDEEDAQ